MDDLTVDEGSNMQLHLWQTCLKSKLQAVQAYDYTLYTQLAAGVETASYTSTFAALGSLYSRNGLASQVPLIRMVLDSVRPFVAGISTMVQSDPTVAALVWGSVQIMLEAVSSVARLFESIADMTQQLSKVLPRLSAYAQLSPTPRLCAALREVYELYVDFFIGAAKILRTGGDCIAVRAHMSSIARDFHATMLQLERATADFDREAQLASVQVDATRHHEIMTRPTSNEQRFVCSGLQARNSMFCGREENLKQLESYLLPVEIRSNFPRARRSCAIHAAGGMGKTQLALEFIWRFKAFFTHVFWLRAETEAVLTESYFGILDKLGIRHEETPVDKKMEYVREYLRSTTDTWLLVYDNVESAASIRHTWPDGDTGALIITTQMPDLGDMTSFEIHLAPLSKEDGSELIRKHLRRGGSEQQSAELLSQKLGGHPLAIAHFAGFVARSQCSLDHILHSLEHRSKSSDIWSQTGFSSTSGYKHTLETVWNLAFRRLTPKARELLDVIAFLEPDQIWEQLFIGPSIVNDHGPHKFWDSHEFDMAVSSLRERNLIGRQVSTRGEFVSTHRALQQGLLIRMDKEVEYRGHIFDQAFLAVRKAFPRYDSVNRGDPTHWPICEKFIPHLASLNTAFCQATPPLTNSMEFAELLRDGAMFLYNWHVQEEAVSMLHSAERICETEENKSQPHTIKLHALIKADLGIYDQYLGVHARDSSIKRTSEALTLYSGHNAQAEDLTKLDHIAIGRFHLDHACCCLANDNVELAAHHLQQGLPHYSLAGDAQSMKVRFGSQKVLTAVVLTGLKRQYRVESLFNEGLELIEAALGKQHHLFLWFQVLRAMCYFSLGQVSSALRLHEEVLRGRKRLHSRGHHEILSSQYLMAVAHHRLHDLEAAEELLLEVAHFDQPSTHWRNEDIARTQFRFSIILKEQGKPRQAAQHADQAFKLRAQWEKELYRLSNIPEAHDSSLTDYDQMILFDLGVSFWHGRTSGKWSSDDELW